MMSATKPTTNVKDRAGPESQEAIKDGMGDKGGGMGTRKDKERAKGGGKEGFLLGRGGRSWASQDHIQGGK